MTAFTEDSARHEEMRSPARISLAIVDQAAGVGGDVDGKLLRGTGEFAQIGVVHLQCVDVVQEEFDCLSGSILIAVPEQPFDAVPDRPADERPRRIVMRATPRAYWPSTVRRMVM